VWLGIPAKNGARPLGAAVWAHGRLGAWSFGRRALGRWHMSEGKPWHRAVSDPKYFSSKNYYHISNF